MCAMVCMMAADCIAGWLKSLSAVCHIMLALAKCPKRGSVIAEHAGDRRSI